MNCHKSSKERLNHHKSSFKKATDYQIYKSLINSSNPSNCLSNNLFNPLYIMKSTRPLISVCLIFLSAQFPLITAYSTGAPDRACSTLIPQHNADPQRYFPSPFIISANKLGSSHSSREFNVSITAKAESFKGFILQARDAHDPENLIVDGAFTPNLFTKVIKCKSHLPNTLTHNSPSDKYYTSVIWKPSNNFKDGKLIFRGTVVLNAKTFWTVDSNPVEVSASDYGKTTIIWLFF